MASSGRSVFKENGRRVAEATGRLLRRTGSLAAGAFSYLAADQTRRVVRKGSRRIEELIEAKRREFISHARSEAELFMAEQVALIEAKVDEKIAEIEDKVDQQIEKELRHKLKLLAWTLLAVVVVSLASLAYLAARRYLGL
jgi:gas vesicle protein